MSRDEESGSWGMGCLIALLAGVLFLACGGVIVVGFGTAVYMARSEAARQEAVVRAEMARAQAQMAEAEEQMAKLAAELSVGHVIQIGADGQLKWDNDLVDFEQLRQKILEFERLPRRGEIDILPHPTAPPEVVEQVVELTKSVGGRVKLPPAPAPADPNAPASPQSTPNVPGEK